MVEEPWVLYHKLVSLLNILRFIIFLQSPGDAAVTTKKLSAKEYREMLANKKKSDPRQSNLSAKDKLAMFQRL